MTDGDPPAPAPEQPPPEQPPQPQPPDQLSELQPPQPPAEPYPPPQPPVEMMAQMPPMVPPELPLVPHDASLTEAVGAPSPAARKRKARTQAGEPDAPDAPRSRRTMAIVAVSTIAALVIVALAFLGHANADRFAIACDASRATPEQGRAFPPWGTRALTGPEWKPIALPTDAECKARETDSEDELAGWYLDLLLERASAILSAKNPLELPPIAAGQPQPQAPLDVASEQLAQALLLARAPERRDQRKELERLQGDVDYWRASAHLREASAALLDAAKQFDAAAAQRPRHVSDAAAWSAFLRHLADELHTGPSGPAALPTAPSSVASPGSPSSPSSSSSPSQGAPTGTALPIEPAPDRAPEQTDAGVPAGGVLL